MTRLLALDTSVAVPYMLRSHTHHHLVRERLAGADLHLTAHSLIETYAVVTRLPGDARLAAGDAARLIDATFGPAYTLPPKLARALPATLAALGIAGGATYDAVVALAAREAAVPLATRDARAAATYRAVGVDVELVADAVE